MRLVLGVPEHHVSRRVLAPVLEAATRLNEDMIRAGEVPTIDEALKKGLFKWKPEPPGEERVDNAETVLARGWGDCDDLAPWAAASDRATGKDPGATADLYKSGEHRWHAIQKRSDGSVRDPSLEAGMRKHEGIFAPTVALAASPTEVSGGARRPTVSLRPVRVKHCVGWQARADMPMSDTDSALVALHYAPTAANAAIGAVAGAARLAHVCGTMVEPDTWEPLDAIAGCLAGLDVKDVRSMCGAEATDRALEWCRRAHEVVGKQLFFLPTSESVGFDLFNPSTYHEVVDNPGKVVSEAAKNLSHPDQLVRNAAHSLQPIVDGAKALASNAVGIISLIPGIGTGVAAALSAGLAVLEGGSPLDIAIRTAYGALPIPPGVRMATDVVLNAVLGLVDAGGNVGAAGLAALRNGILSKVPDFARGLAGSAFDTLAHLVVQAVSSKPTTAATSKVLTAPQIRGAQHAHQAGKPLPSHLTPIAPKAKTQLAVHLALAASPLYAGAPKTLEIVPPSGVLF